MTTIKRTTNNIQRAQGDVFEQIKTVFFVNFLSQFCN